MHTVYIMYFQQIPMNYHIEKLNADKLLNSIPLNVYSQSDFVYTVYLDHK